MTTTDSKHTGERLVREQSSDRSSQPPSGGPRWRASVEPPISSNYGAHMHSTYHDPLRPVQPYAGELPPPAFTLGSNIHEPSNSNAVHGFNFDMWVSAPQQADRRPLHTYTQLQGDQNRPGAPPTALESLPGWRSEFPRLNSLVSGQHGPLDCDIILLEVNLELMNDFPPSGSRLGIQLDLDFGHPTAGDVSMVSQMDDWVCSTYLYEHGRSMLESHHDLQKPSSTKVKPLFESSWWAKRFTQLTQDKRMDEDAGQHHAANERPRQYFHSLTAVQEIRATLPNSGRLSNQLQPHGQDESKMMAILVWKFRQTRPNEVGTTTWRKLVPPSDRGVTSSPRPMSGIDLPPLSLDSVAMSKSGPSIYHPPAPQPQDLLHNNSMSQQHWPMYQPPSENVGNVFNTPNSLDFLSSITREDGIPDRPAATSVLDSFSGLQQPETSQPASMNVSGDAPVMSEYSLSNSQLGGYGVGHDNHYVPSNHQGVHDTSRFLHSILGSGPPPMDDIGHNHASWGPPPPPPTSIPEVGTSNYSLHFQPSDHEGPVARESHHSNGIDGLMPPDWLDKFVGGDPGMHAAGPDHVNSSYAENAVEAV